MPSHPTFLNEFDTNTLHRRLMAARPLGKALASSWSSCSHASRAQRLRASLGRVSCSVAAARGRVRTPVHRSGQMWPLLFQKYSWRGLPLDHCQQYEGPVDRSIDRSASDAFW